MIDVRELKLDNNRRVIVTSDIHANLALFQELLEKGELYDRRLFIHQWRSLRERAGQPVDGCIC